MVLVLVSVGTMSDWKLVFYGTETAPEHEDDEDSVQISGSKVDLKSSVVLSSGEEDPDDNDVEPVKGGVWKELHQVDSTDHTRNEVQRTTTEDDMASASAGCLALSKKGQQCIGLCLLVICLVSVLNSSVFLPTLFATNCDGNMSQPKCTKILDGGSTFPCPMIFQQWRTEFTNGIRTERTVSVLSEISDFQTMPH
jgi:hypothetical protein